LPEAGISNADVTRVSNQLLSLKEEKIAIFGKNSIFSSFKRRRQRCVQVIALFFQLRAGWP